LILLISCSKLKSDKPGRARDVYTGDVTRLGIGFAEKFKLRPLILSAKYGIIGIDEIIEPYNLKATQAYKGPWPKESGFWLGGEMYFLYVPDHIRRLTPEGMSYCQMKSWLNKIVNPHRYQPK
jgi:hypothetical protein